VIFVGVCGGREYSNLIAVRRAIAELAERIREEFCVIEGGARGADSLCSRVAIEMGISYGTFPAMWDQHGKSAGPRRNAVMAELPLRYLLAFPGGPGTADMVRRCRAKGIEVIEVKP